VGDTRGVPLTVAGNDGLRRVVGRVITDKDYNPRDLLIDDPETLRKVLKKVEEGSFHLEM
jgi:hypothetical protein